MNDIISIIDKTIINRREEVINSLLNSSVEVSDTISNLKIRDLIIKEVKSGNGFLIYNLGNVISKELPPEIKSNFVGLAISIGSSLLGKLFGGGGGNKEAERLAKQEQYQRDRQEAEMIRQMKIAASQQEANRIRDDVRRIERKARTKRTVVTISIIGGTLIIGTIVTIFILKNKK